jgi:hypothetical protein
MPRLPLSGLILRHPDVAFRILKGALDPKRCACMLANFVTLVSALALLKLYLTVVGESTSRRTIRCRQRAVGLFLSQSHTRRCSTSTTRSPLVVSLNVFLVPTFLPAETSANTLNGKQRGT